MYITTSPTNIEVSCRRPLNARSLRVENDLYRGSGGVSEENRTAGFVPAFLDSVTGIAYRSRFADGRPAPVHLLEGLPNHLLNRYDETGGITSPGAGLISGFLRLGRFYTRSEAANAMNSRCQI